MEINSQSATLDLKYAHNTVGNCPYITVSSSYLALLVETSGSEWSVFD